MHTRATHTHVRARAQHIHTCTAYNTIKLGNKEPTYLAIGALKNNDCVDGGFNFGVIYGAILEPTAHTGSNTLNPTTSKHMLVATPLNHTVHINED